MADLPKVAFVENPEAADPDLKGDDFVVPPLADDFVPRFQLDEAQFMFDIGYIPPAARPENFAYYTALLDELAGEPPVFLADPSDAFLEAETYPRRFARG